LFPPTPQKRKKRRIPHVEALGIRHVEALDDKISNQAVLLKHQ
jgi:hypothetical protein